MREGAQDDFHEGSLQIRGVFQLSRNLQRRVVVHLGNILPDGAVRIMVQLSLQPSPVSSHREAAVHFRGLHDIFVPSKQPERIVRVPASVPDPFSQRGYFARHRVAFPCIRGVDCSGDLFTEWAGDFFIGIDVKQPVPLRPFESPLALRDVSVVFMPDDVRRVPSGQLHRPIGAERIDHDDFAGPSNAFETAFDVLFFVVGDEDDGECRHRSYRTTRLTSLFFTMTIFRTGFPSRCRTTFSSASTSFLRASSSILTATENFDLTLPLIWTTISTASTFVFDSSYDGQGS